MDNYTVQRRNEIVLRGGKMQIIGVVSGEVRVGCALKKNPVLRAGEFCLIPAILPATELIAETGTVFLRAQAG